MKQDHTLETLLHLDGYIVVLEKGYWIKVEVRRASYTVWKPFGIKYSLTLHDPDGDRILGFDNAHARPGSSSREPHDHIHLGRVRPYVYTSAAKLLEDFWKAVETCMKKEGITL